ncbi:hypothetical protein FNH22_17645 [Fulvivirga sp. M361]|uniref:LON peptidase substrate-binding domain-containing protein n=1 Tax=Fulvivirga sp. M361 TaxID=2594266 RepID=UPI00117B5193|nr:LON peptidase substrate-binding domain-containing protein [Fulvivirga sp. M361]TRX55986.1 hypothetical protein FNH22_17645 [Fulvivirga sp. M361]
MDELKRIPVFPLNILPLPGELVPLHIFEPRYRELLKDVEVNDIEFGILFAHPSNEKRLGSLVKLESILKRYETGESDIVVKCVDTFILSKFYNQLSPKLYPGGAVFFLNAMDESSVSADLSAKFEEYMVLRNSKIDDCEYNIHDIANELDLDLTDRVKYLRLLTSDKRQQFINERLDFRKHVLDWEVRSKDNYYLN